MITAPSIITTRVKVQKKPMISRINPDRIIPNPLPVIRDPIKYVKERPCPSVSLSKAIGCATANCIAFAVPLKIFAPVKTSVVVAKGNSAAEHVFKTEAPMNPFFRDIPIVEMTCIQYNRTGTLVDYLLECFGNLPEAAV